ncbi:ATPase-like protein [Xylariaceae sp. FL0016]|nr:ATPase-like protein [Xylariaceae sp. FL0016]
MFSACPADSLFGPSVSGCRDDFDFTIKFESSILSLLPSCVFVATCVPRIFHLSRRQKVVRGCRWQYTKVIAASFSAALQLILLVLCTGSPGDSSLLIPSLAVSFAAALSAVVLSYLEHSRSLRPSILLHAYLAVTTLFDVARTRTFYLAAVGRGEFVFTCIFATSTAIKAVLLLLEAFHKTRWLSVEDEKRSPEERAGLFGLGAFIWLNTLFMTGYRNILKLDDLYPLDQSMATDALSRRLESSIRQLPSKGIGLGLLTALWNTLSASFLFPIGPRAALIGFKFSQPFLINTLLDYMDQPPGSSPDNWGYGLIGAALCIYTGIAFSTALYWYFHERSLAMVRGALVGAVYRSTTRMKLSAAGDGAAITLMSTDVERIRLGLLNLHEFWANGIEVGLASWLLYRQVGAAFAAPLVVVILCILGGAYLNKFTGRRTKAWMDKVQDRVRLTANVISRMKHLKLSGLTGPVQSLIQAMRVDELRTASAYRRVHISVVTLGITPTALCPVALFALTSRNLDVSTIFTSLSYILLLADPLAYLFQNSPALLSAIACLDRIQAYLEHGPVIDYRSSDRGISGLGDEKSSSGLSDEDHGLSSAIVVRDGNFGWKEGALTLKDINLDIASRCLTIIVGPVASGKSTLCKALLGELPVSGTRVFTKSALLSNIVGYCDQVPFLWSASMRKNIIGFAPFIETRYREVIEATMLGPDIAGFAQGDATEVGSDGIKLSGGQKQRLSIARALYLETNFLIFDDVLSGLDAGLDDQVFRRVFGPQGLLRRRHATVILCTHAIHHVRSADHVIALRPDGRVIHRNRDQALESGTDAFNELDIEPAEPTRPQQTMTQCPPANNDTETHDFMPSEVIDHSHIDETDRMMGDSTVYSHYVHNIGTFSAISCLLLGLGYGFFYNWGQIWLNYWSTGSKSNAFYIGLYALFQSCFLAFLFFDFLVCYTTLIQTSGSSLHEAALNTVIKAPLSFFTQTDTGSITNLFSQDMTLIDNELPIALANFVMDSANALGMAAVIASSSPYLAITYPVIFSILYFIQRFHLRTSRQLRLLDLEAKTPLYSHFIDTIKGLATFRASGWTSAGIELNSRLLDASQRPYYLLYIVQRWLLFALQIVVALLAVSVVALATQLRGNTALTGASLVTLMTFGDVLNYIIRWWTQLETSIGAVSRLKNFSEKVEPESVKGEDVVPAPTWPLEGFIRVAGVSASYGVVGTIAAVGDGSTETNDVALKNLNLLIQPGERVAICGRSGSGKSSTLSLLLKLLNPLPSCIDRITIDDLPLHKIDRDVLRERIIAVPQEPVFLPDGTPYMVNLDPFGTSTKDVCQSVLEVVGLWPYIETKGGLAAGLVADDLSQGQKQLFNLARALSRRRVRAAVLEAEFGAAGMSERGGTGILLLDEISSSVDLDTDRLMQRVIEEEFRGYTVVMVSHRLEMVMGFDRVVVMDRGEIVEDGIPAELVEMKGSRFAELWDISSRR